MCGIAGFYGTPDTPVPRALILRRMIGAIAHRGPDAQGTFDDDRAALGHVRLSIIDLATGAQPMPNGDRTIWVTFNGEIFNYVELREGLISRGHSFRSASDTEVILHLYEEMGPDCVNAFNGDFAFALWDSRQNLLMLARDRMGVRPVFYTVKNGCLFFASEVKALLQVPGISAELDPIALDQIFTFWFPLAPRTSFKDVFELPPAHVLIARPNQIMVRRYWRLQYPDAGDDSALNEQGEEAIGEELGDLLVDATRIRLRSDVPVGAYLSGGLDSSIIAAMTNKIAPARLQTFSVTFRSAEFDESGYQQEMVRALKARHASVACSAAEIGESFPTVIRHGEQPILRTAPAPLLALSDLVHSSGFKVVLTGEGADEIFAGYDIFKEAKIRRFWARQPQSQSRPRLFKLLYPYLPGLQGHQKYLEAFFGNGLAETSDPVYSHLPRFRTTAGAKIFFSDALLESIRGYDAVADLRESLPAEFDRWHPLSQAQYLETALLLPGYILSSQGDRVAMAHAVECRFPFLDHRVVEFAARIPPKLKIRGLREKHILRESTRTLLPSTINNRAKQPYRSPDSLSFLGFNQPDYVDGCLSTSELAASGWFNSHAVDKLVRKCRTQALAGFRDNMAFVGILSTQLWHREFVCGATSLVPPVHPPWSLEEKDPRRDS
jgi:asparagine synthase (glutamine-hydrolysing)